MSRLSDTLGHKHRKPRDQIDLAGPVHAPPDSDLPRREGLPDEEDLQHKKPNCLCICIPPVKFHIDLVIPIFYLHEILLRRCHVLDWPLCRHRPCSCTRTRWPSHRRSRFISHFERYVRPSVPQTGRGRSAVQLTGQPTSRASLGWAESYKTEEKYGQNYGNTLHG